MERCTDSKGAFTLLEMLVALVLVSVLTLSLYASLRTSFNAQESVRASLEPTRAAEAAMALLRSDIESALPPTGLLAGEFYGESAIGENGQDGDMFYFHTCSGGSDIEYTDDADESTLSLSLSKKVQSVEPIRADLQRVEFLLVRDSEGTDLNLVRNVTKNLLAPTTPEPIEQVICRNVLSFNVRYLDGSDWVDSWDSTQQENALPPALEVSLKLRLTEEENSETEMLLRQGEERTRQLVMVVRPLCAGPSTEDGNVIIR